MKNSIKSKKLSQMEEPPKLLDFDVFRRKSFGRIPFFFLSVDEVFVPFAALDARD